MSRALRESFHRGMSLRPDRNKFLAVLGFAVAIALVATGMTRGTRAAVPNTVAQWDKIAEDAVVRSGAFQNEGLIYMAYVSAAVYNAVVAIEGGYQPYGQGVSAPVGASTDAAVIEAAYRTLVNYFPTQAPLLDQLYDTALAAILDGQAKTDGQWVGQAAANLIINMRTFDARMTPIGTTSLFATRNPAPGVWRLTPPAFAAPQTPWVGNVTPFVLQSADQFLPDGPPSLLSVDWVEAFNEIELHGSATNSARTDAETATALFWTANVIRQYNQALRDVINAKGLTLLESARLQAMVNIVGADAQIAVMNAKYHFLFWRPVTAIDPSAVKPAPGDGFGPIPGYDDGNSMTLEQSGWRPLVATPNHPEYPAAHGSITSAMAEVFRSFAETNHFNLVIHGFDPSGAPGNLNAVRTFNTPGKLRDEIVDARVWAGLHYRFSGVAGVVMGRQVAKYDLSHAFQRVR